MIQPDDQFDGLAALVTITPSLISLTLSTSVRVGTAFFNSPSTLITAYHNVRHIDDVSSAMTERTWIVCPGAAPVRLLPQMLDVLPDRDLAIIDLQRRFRRGKVFRLSPDLPRIGRPCRLAGYADPNSLVPIFDPSGAFPNLELQSVDLEPSRRKAAGRVTRVSAVTGEAAPGLMVSTTFVEWGGLTEPGMSGAPLIDCVSGLVCGVHHALTTEVATLGSVSLPANLAIAVSVAGDVGRLLRR